MVELESVKVGGETSAYCTSCRDMRLHVVVAMEGGVPAKVECRSCHRQHKYRAALPGTKKESTRPATRPARDKGAGQAAAVAVVSDVNPLEALLAARPANVPRAYSPAERYAVGDIVTHPNFGIGAVTGTPAPGKIAVLFRDTTRLLLHERTAAVSTAERLQPPPRRQETPSNEPSQRPPKVKSIL